MTYAIVSFRYLSEQRIIDWASSLEEAQRKINDLATKEKEDRKKSFIHRMGDEMYFTYLPIGEAK